MDRGYDDFVERFATSALTSNGSRDLLGSRRIGGAGREGSRTALARLLTFVESGDGTAGDRGAGLSREGAYVVGSPGRREPGNRL